MSERQRCGSCRYWVQTPADSGPYCHESPLLVATTTKHISPYTYTWSPDQWCGKWVPREGAGSEPGR